MTFIKGVLANKKKLLKNHEAIPVNFPRLKSLTVEQVLMMGLGDADIAEYLPDKEDIESNYMDRSFLFTIVNTLEPTFF
jgi:hypothetical protein